MRRGTWTAPRWARVWVLALGLACGSASANESVRPEFDSETLIEAARAALAQGAPDDAEILLKGVRPGKGGVDDLDFLYGSIALQRGEWDAAIERFRAMLARNPNLPRVRLDLAFAYFQAGRDTNAAYHFRQALGAEDLPAIARARALGFLDAIRRRKSWSLSAAFAIAPDSNINAATSARLVELFGLPATLSEDARRTSGVGFSADLSGSYEARLAPDLRFRTGAALYTRTYGDSRFNDRTLALQAGPRYLSEDFEIRPEMTARFRQLGGEMYSRAFGVRLSSQSLLTPEWRLSAGGSVERVSYESFLGDGHRYGAQLGLAHALGGAATVRADASFRRETVQSEANSWREYALGLSAARELPLGFVVSAGPSLRWRHYDAPSLTLGRDRRRDRTVGAHVKVSNRNVEFLGFMPELTLRHERRASNLDLYDYKRTAGEVGVVRAF